ncbi:hypothetical protein SAMN05428989_0885 [Pseudoxanthomonas sp. GM95]|uniref:hypothetical protein n=1 Tax=Pseudoxanthomonas sp. GM95 TaxID=1881043 RepID=UPI0008D0B4B0|nr:hypothetical protein [Pseudoxanthomonas sp. GM95]SEK82903.1 hypothetical protein SAMN05428989_0885 [Pseudoxanthomonas sp. GM95]
MQSRPQRLVVATAGLDLLPATRLKVACSLLMADLLEITVVPWSGGNADLLVADASSSEGGSAIRTAWAARMAVLTFSREASGEPDSGELLPTASVRQIADALKAGLAARRASQPGAVPRSMRLIDRLRLDADAHGEAPVRMLMELGLLRVVVDPLDGRLHMLRRMPLDELLDKAQDQRWQSSPLSDAQWLQVYQPDVTLSYPIEMLWWRLAAREAIELPVIALPDTGLASWPDLDIGNTPATWLPVLAQLRVRAWQPTALATATGAPLPTVRRIMTAVRLSGLCQVQAEREDTIGRRGRRMAEPEARSFLRIARRFGLKLMGLKRG